MANALAQGSLIEEQMAAKRSDFKFKAPVIMVLRAIASKAHFNSAQFLRSSRCTTSGVGRATSTQSNPFPFPEPDTSPTNTNFTNWCKDLRPWREVGFAFT